jgi:hypothetical protein
MSAILLLPVAFRVLAGDSCRAGKGVLLLEIKQQEV